MQNPHHYAGLVEDWKIQLFEIRARMKGFQGDELPELLQEIILDIVHYKYDASKGAQEKTVLTRLIDNKLNMILRTNIRRSEREETIRIMYTRPEGTSDLTESHRHEDMRTDVGALTSRLSPVEQKICAGLANEDSYLAIAQSLDISRYELDRKIARIREQFILGGMYSWLKS